MATTNTKAWQIPVRRVPTVQKVDRSVVWNNTHVCYEQQLFGQATMVTYNNSGSMVGAVSTNQALLLRCPHSDGAVWNEQMARPCHSLRFRDDDKMTIQTIERRVVIKSTETALERFVEGHTRDARDALFLNNQTLVSASDDTTVRAWDLIGQSELAIGRFHTDYVRSLARHSDGCFLSASYDHQVALWDVRTTLSAPSNVIKPGTTHPIEKVLFVASKGLIVCSAGDIVSIFDQRSTSKPLAALSFHTKAVTALAYCPSHKVLITGSLDQRVKFLAVEDDYRVIASKKFPSAVTALDIHPDATELAVATATGHFQIQKIEVAAAVVGKVSKAEDEAARLVGEAREISAEEKKEELLKKKVGEIRQLLVVYQYHKAIKSALYSRMPDVIVTTLEELQRRGALHVALSGHHDRGIVQLLRFAVERVDFPPLTDLMLIVIDTIIEIYSVAASHSAFFHRELIIAQRRIGEALMNLRSMESTIGLMELIVDGC